MADNGDQRSFRERVEEALAQGLDIPDFPNTTPLGNLAAGYNEAVGEFEKSGFTRQESLWLVSAMFCGNPGQGPVH